MHLVRWFMLLFSLLGWQNINGHVRASYINTIADFYSLLYDHVIQMATGPLL